MIEGRTILCFASGYDAPPTSKHHVMHLLAERNTVLWVNYHASRRPSRTWADLAGGVAKLRQVCRGRQRRRSNLHVLTPMVVPAPNSRWARRTNRRLLTAQLRRALRRLDAGPVQVWSFAPDIAYVLDGLDVEKVVYYCVDEFSQFAGYDAQQVRADEAELCRRADLVVTTSEALQQAKRPLNRNTILVPHGVDYEHFAKAVTDDLPEPADLADLPHPRLGFFGLIHEWVDVALLAAAARLRAQWQWVLIGDANVDLSALKGLPNVHVLGRRPYEQLPAYCRALDVGLIPFVVNDLTRSVNPIKLREYLAAGLPVVSTPLPEVTRGDWPAATADTPEAFIAAVEAALAEPADTRAQRSRGMADQTWRAKVEDICAALTAPAVVTCAGEPTA